MFGKTAEQLIDNTMSEMMKEQQLDQQVLPECIKDLISQEKIFRIHLAKQSFESGVPNFIINKTFDQERSSSSHLSKTPFPLSPAIVPQRKKQITPESEQIELPTGSKFPVPCDFLSVATPAQRKEIRFASITLIYVVYIHLKIFFTTKQ